MQKPASLQSLLNWLYNMEQSLKKIWWMEFEENCIEFHTLDLFLLTFEDAKVFILYTILI